MEKGVLVNKTPIIIGVWNIWTGILVKEKHWTNIETLTETVKASIEPSLGYVKITEDIAQAMDFIYEPKGGLVLVTDHQTVYSVVWGEALEDADVKGEILRYLFQTGDLW